METSKESTKQNPALKFPLHLPFRQSLPIPQAPCAVWDPVVPALFMLLLSKGQKIQEFKQNLEQE